LQRIEEAERQYVECLAIDRQHAVCLANFGQLMQQTARYKEAEQYFKRCLAINDENANCQHHFAVLLSAVGRWTESRFHFSRAIALSNGQRASYHFNFGKLLVELKEFGAAKEHFSECIELEPENAAFLYEFALFLAFEVDDVAQSVAYFVRAYRCDPLHPDIARKYDEIAGIVTAHGLRKERRRKSSARGPATNGSVRRNTVIEYKEEEHDPLSSDDSPCQAEFARFLRDVLSSSIGAATLYLERFRASELNDIRYLSAMDSDTLTKDVAMAPVHAKVVMARIAQFQEHNAEFIEWLRSLRLHEYYATFEGAAILTFSHFYKKVDDVADLLRILGDRNHFDAHLLWKALPKFKRRDASQPADDDNDGDGDPHHLGVCRLDARNSNSNLSARSQIEGKQKGTI